MWVAIATGSGGFIFVFADLKNNLFQKKEIIKNMNNTPKLSSWLGHYICNV